jgi:hypothetical protein
MHKCIRCRNTSEDCAHHHRLSSWHFWKFFCQLAGSWDHILVTSEVEWEQRDNRDAKLASWDETECDQAGCMDIHAQLSVCMRLWKGITLQNLCVCNFYHELDWLACRDSELILKYLVGLWRRTETWQGVCLNVIVDPGEWEGPGPRGAVVPWEKNWNRRRFQKITLWVSYVVFFVNTQGTMRRMRWMDV